MTHAPTPDTPPHQLKTPYAQMGWMLDRFVERVPRVTHAVLLSKDGLILLSNSDTDKDLGDTLAGAFCGFASLAEAIPGPGEEHLAAKQIMVERPDILFFIMVAGRGYCSAFSPRPETQQGMVDTVLGVLADPSADARVVGHEMDQLIKQFAHYMQTPVRASSTYDSIP